MNTNSILAGARTFLSALVRPNGWKRTGMSALLPALCLLSSVLSPLPSALAGIFSGNARVEISDPNGELSLSTSATPRLTVQCWFKISIPSGVSLSDNMTILVNRTNGTTGDPHAYNLWYDKDAHNIQFSTKGTGPSLWQAILIPDTKFILGRWYHVAVVRDETAVAAYVDGQFATNTTDLASIGNSRSTNGVSIGGWGNGKYLYGEVQEVSIYQLALDLETQIKLWMYTPQPSDVPQQKGYYKLGVSTNSDDYYKNFAFAPPPDYTDPGRRQGAGQILFEETNAKGEQSLFDSMVDGGQNAVVPLSGAFAWQHSAFSRPVPGVPFDFSIAYVPGASGGSLGGGWRHSFETKAVVESPNLIKVVNWQGGIETWETTNAFTTPWRTRHGEYRGGLTEDTGPQDVFWTNAQQHVYCFPHAGGSSVQGKLAEIRDLNGNSMVLQWHPSLVHITNVIDSAGGSHPFRYDDNTLLLTNVAYREWQVQFGYTNITVSGQVRTVLASKTLINTSGLYTNLGSTTWKFYYNTNNGLLEKIINPAGYTNLYVQYDNYGRRINTINAEGDSTGMEYGTPGNRQVRTTDPDGFQWIDTYDRKGRVIAQRDPLGNETRSAYDEHGNRTAVTDPLGNTTFSGYDERGNLLARTNALGEVTRWTYHPFFNKPLTQTDPLGWVTSYQYDSAGKLTNQFDNLGRIASSTYTTKGLLLTKTDANGHTTTNAYNADGFVTAQTDAAGFTTHFTPNELGWNLATINPLTEQTTYAYDLNGKVVRTVDPLPRTYFATNDPCGDLCGQTDGKGKWTRYTYDGLRHKTSETNRFTATKTFSYTSRGKLDSTTDALGRPTTYQYDNANRQTAVVDALTNTTTTVYDANGNAVATIDPLGRRWTKTFDQLNRVVAESDPFGNITQTLYDPAGRVRETIAPNGSRTVNAYDGRGRLTDWVDAAGSSWHCDYDGVGNIINITDARGGQYVMAYGPRNERTLERNQDGKQWVYTYDALLRLKTQIEPNGTNRTLYYDAGGRMTSVVFSTGRVNSFSYDANDNVTRLSRTGSGPPDTTLLDYDALDRVSRSTNTFGQTLAYAYDLAGRLTTLTYPYGGTLTNGYDVLDRLTNQVFQLTAGQTYTTSYGYDQAGQLVRRVYPNGMVQTNTFDAAGRLTGLSHCPLSPQPATLNVALAYAYDRNGNTIRADEKGVFQWPMPALLDQTSRFAAAGGVTNRVDALTPTNNFTYRYDASGNMTNAFGGGQNWTLTYDEDNRTTSVAWDAGITAKIITNRYDALGRRVGRTVKGVETRYVLDLAGGMERILCDVTPAGVITAWYVHGPDLAFKVDVNGGLNCYHADAQGNMIALTGANGTTLIEYAYTPYGRSLGSTNRVQQPALDDQPFLFAGSQGVMMEERGVPGLYFMRARYYSADAGVFLSTDPVRNIGPTWRPIAYAYADGNPLRYNDPKGEIWGTIISAIDIGYKLATHQEVTTLDWVLLGASIALDIATWGVGSDAAWLGLSVVKTLKGASTILDVVDVVGYVNDAEEGKGLAGLARTGVEKGAEAIGLKAQAGTAKAVSAPSVWSPRTSPVFMGCNCGE
jgi:RHS repeat-associated protein